MAPDWEITGDLTLDLRAERSGSGTGREYTITVQCTDGTGNFAPGVKYALARIIHEGRPEATERLGSVPDEVWGVPMTVGWPLHARGSVV